MKHAREDYNRIQDPHGIIPEDEPVFLLRGQDMHSPKLLRIYADMVAEAGGDSLIVEATLKQADAMDEWHLGVRVKEPDLPQPPEA